MIAQSQLIHETTVLRHIKDSLQLNKLKPENGGSEGYFSFSYKKPKGAPHKFDVEKQQQFMISRC